MASNTTTWDSELLLAGEGWREGIEAGVRGQVRSFIEAVLEEELKAALGRERYERLKVPAEPGAMAQGLGNGEAAASPEPTRGHRNGRRAREIIGTFGATTVAVPRARLNTADGGTTEWQNKTLAAYRRRTKEVDALICVSR